MRHVMNSLNSMNKHLKNSLYFSNSSTQSSSSEVPQYDFSLFPSILSTNHFLFLSEVAVP